MRTLTIEATTLETEQGFYSALSEFHAELIESDDGICRVSVTLGDDGRDEAAVLDAIQQYVADRGDVTPLLDLGGRSFTMHPPLTAIPQG